jgi:hypothetical protein
MTRMGRARAVALLAAAIAWVALALQLWLLIGQFADQGKGAGEAVWRFVGFFTIIANLAAAITASAMALRLAARPAGPRMRLAMAATMVLVGLTYSVALRHIWSPSGWAAVADHTLHDASPFAFLLAWLLSDHGRLGWRDSLWALPLPATYFGYAMLRGAGDGWYAYWFLDPAALPPVRFMGNVVLLMAICWAIGLLLVAIDRRLARRGA